MVRVIQDVGGASKENHFVSVLVSDGNGDSVVAFYVPTLSSVSGGREVKIGTVKIIIDRRDLRGTILLQGHQISDQGLRKELPKFHITHSNVAHSFPSLKPKERVN